ncbi:MAG: septum site-determining protein MinC [Polaromonas sp.]|nr:MAG: septum site-determining protein MinC [Polaromonas sp.]
MTVAISATTPTTFEIKSANLPLVALLLKSTDLAALQRELTSRFGDIPDFFDQDALVIDLSPLQAGPDHAAPELDFHNLSSLLRTYRLNPIAVKGGSSAQMAAALGTGLIPTPDAYLLGNKAKKPTQGAPDDTGTAPAAARATPESPPAQAPAVATAVMPAPGQLSALVIDKPLRSGQQVYARGRDLVVLAMVSAGAEVIADGHIHVYAPLRGKAIAGARGNTDARIFALALEAQLLSIAGVYRTGENPLPDHVQGKPAQVRLVTTADGDKLMMDAM